ncbi:MAG: adenine phosphoribosyltransferase [Cyclobacteriaceae bacterium]|nr:adenine phosphoribosyltransferase [Cyclobacteriaceae bacterium]MCX7637771.1 adenine phosphoribosyltransferase [Cyclobacteriaceae bacterium]MDW8331843.1 adenine phosphoribosyltransferase [Cyclobacteriaceae bacterium]
MIFNPVLEEKLKRTIRDIPDYPKPGIVFKDITPVLSDPQLIKDVARALLESALTVKPDAVVAVEARGFIFGGLLAHFLNCPFIPVRKTGKLPYRTVTESYALEYGTSTVEMHQDALQAGWRVLIHDDLLATGGTAGAAAALVQKLGGEIAGFSFMINLSFLPGEETLIQKYGAPVSYLVKF